MKTNCIIIILLAAAVAGSGAQESNSNSGITFKSKTEKTPKERVAFLLDVGRAYLQAEDNAAAMNAFERALEIDPKNAELRYILGHVYIAEKKYKEAELLLVGLLKETPDDFKLWNNLAWLYATAEDNAYRNGTKAVTFAREALLLAPNDYHVWSTLSEAYYVSGEYEKANRAIEHMANLAATYGKNITEKEVEEYNAQIRKCRRAVEALKTIEGE